MEQETVQELPSLIWLATFLSNSGFRFNSKVEAESYDEAYKEALIVAAEANKKNKGQRSAVVLSVVDVVRA